MVPFLDDFLKRTSLHGCQRLTDSNRYRVLRFAWLLFILTAIAALCVRLAELHTDYKKYNTKSKYSIRTHTKLAFPSVTVCNLSPYSSKNIIVTPALENFLIATSSSFGDMSSPINWTEHEYSTLQEEDLGEWHDKASTQLEDMLMFCKVDGAKVNCSDQFSVTETDIGRCFTFNQNGRFYTYLFGNQNGLEVFVNIRQDEYILSDLSSAGVKVFIHPPGEEPSVHAEGTIIGPGTETYIQVYNRKFLFKPYPYTYNGQDYCLDTEAEDFINPLKVHKQYSWSGCMNECILSSIVQKCGCVTPMMAERWNKTTCRRRGLLECFFANLRETKAKFSNEADLLQVFNKCACEKPCIDNQYYTSTSSALNPSVVAGALFTNRSFIPSTEYARNNLLHLHVYFERLLTNEIIFYPEYSTEDVLAGAIIVGGTVSIGGFMGLFLGASLLSLLEITEILFTSVLQYWTRKLSTKKTVPSDGQENG